MIEGQWSEVGSAAIKQAVLHFDDNGGFRLKVDLEKEYSGQLEDILVSERIGNIPRKLTFSDGSVFSTTNNDAVDQYFKLHIKGATFIHALESKFLMVLIALIVTIIASFSFFKWGVPASSKIIAEKLPHKTNVVIGAQALDFLDDFVLKKSKLSLERQREIRTHFFEKLVPLEKNNEIEFTLHFRDWSTKSQDIPNALALPSGDIILTDEFVRLSQSQQEIDSVLLHEMGHVAHRHSLKMVVHSTLLGSVILLVTGDSGGMADMGIGLGSLLLSSDYSREFESEADEYAFKHMLKADLDPASFSNSMRRMENAMNSDFENEQLDSKENKNILDYLSSHPPTLKRIMEAERYSECYKKGLLECPLIAK